MPAFGGSPGFLPGDADPAWIDLEDDVRVRVAARASTATGFVDSGDGTFDISNVLLNDAVRDTQKGSTTKWPSYTAQGYPTNFVTDAQRRQCEVDRRTPRARSRPTRPSRCRAVPAVRLIAVEITKEARQQKVSGTSRSAAKARCANHSDGRSPGAGYSAEQMITEQREARDRRPAANSAAECA